MNMAKGPLSKRLPWISWFAIVLILAEIGGAPFLLKDNQVAQILFNLLVTVVATAAGIYVSIRLAGGAKEDELTRYGLQAWRNLDSLSIKVSQRLSWRGDAGDNLSPGEQARLNGWLLDIDQAKLAWQDLLKELFILQERMQRETEELAHKYKEQIRAAQTPEDKSKLELRQRREIEERIEKAPLPLRIPEEAKCPECGWKVAGLLGQRPNDTAWLKCPECTTRFPIHRLDSGAIKYGEMPDKIDISVNCPGCKQAISIRAPKKRPTTFQDSCPHCSTHYEYKGNAKNYVLQNLGKYNSSYQCPYCSESSNLWVSPVRSVTFKQNCPKCSKASVITGMASSFSIAKLDLGK
jgi:hypothetical protein